MAGAATPTVSAVTVTSAVVANITRDVENGRRPGTGAPARTCFPDRLGTLFDDRTSRPDISTTPLLRKFEQRCTPKVPLAIEKSAMPIRSEFARNAPYHSHVQSASGTRGKARRQLGVPPKEP